MTNKAWMELIAKEFNVSHTVAKGMLSSMMQTKRYLSATKDARRRKEEEKRRHERQMLEWEECDRDDWEFMHEKGR